MQTFYFLIVTDMIFVCERLNLSESFLLCENDVQLIGLLDRKRHHVIGWIRRVPEV